MLSPATSTLEQQWEIGESMLIFKAGHWYSATVIGVNGEILTFRLEEDVERIVGYRRPVRKLFRKEPIIELFPRKGETGHIRIGNHNLQKT